MFIAMIAIDGKLGRRIVAGLANRDATLKFVTGVGVEITESNTRYATESEVKKLFENETTFREYVY